MKKNLRIIGVVTLLLAVYLVFQFVFSALAMGVYLVHAVISGAIQPEMLQDIPALVESPAVKEFSNESMALGLFLSSLAMLFFIHKTGLFRLRLSLFRSIAFKPLLQSTALVFTSMLALNILVQWLPLENVLENQFEGLTHTFLGALTISLLAPILEEVMFRGAIQGYLTRKLGNPWLAMAIAALVFGVYHMNPVQVVYASMFGFILGWMYYRTGSLMLVIVGHVLNNSIATLAMLMFGTATESEMMEDILPQEAVIASQVMMFIVFAAASVLLVIKLHHSMPAPPVPWHESDEVSE